MTRARKRVLTVTAIALLCAMTPLAHAQPANNMCASATPALAGMTTAGNAQGATPDGSSACSLSGSADVYHTFTTSRAGVYTFSLCAATNWDTVLSLHTNCPADDTTEIACNDEGCGLPGAGVPSVLRQYLPASTGYIIRVAGYDANAGAGFYGLSIAAPPEPTGACCFLGNCGLLTQSGCGTVGGTYLGDYTSCEQASGSPTSYTGPGVPAAIPDNNAAGVSRTITVPASFPVADVRLTLNLTHAWMGDLTVRLTHNGQTVTIFERVGQNGDSAPFGYDLNFGGAYTFTDTGAQTIWDAAATAPTSVTTLPPGPYLSVNSSGFAASLRQAFAGFDAAGAWTITLIDSNPEDAGTLYAWSLQLDASVAGACEPAPDGACCTGTPQGGVGTTCTITSAAACGGSFRGGGTVCTLGANNPVACCKANFDQTDGVTITDIFVFLNAWFSGSPSANFDQVDGVTITDIFVFLNAWFSGCE